MAKPDVLELVRLVAVIGFVAAAAALATPKGRLPLALRGVLKMMRRDAVTSGTSGTPGTFGTSGTSVVPMWKRLLAFSLVLVATLLSLVSL